MRRAALLVLAALALSCAAPAYATRTVAVDAASAVHAFVVGTDGALYHAPPGGVLERVGGSGLAPEPVAVARHGDGRLEVVARGLDGSLQQTAETTVGGAWSAWTPIGTGIAGSPDLLVNGGELELFARGTDGKLWTAVQTATGWGPLESLGFAIDGDPAAVLAGDGSPVVAFRGPGGKSGVIVRDLVAGTWAFDDDADELASDVVVTRNGGGVLDLFMRHVDGGIFQASGGLSALTQLGTETFVGTPAAVVDGAGRVHVFARDAAGALWESYLDGSAFTPWTALGGTLTGDPVAIKDAHGLLQVVAPSTGAAWITRAQSAALTWEPAFRALGDAAPPPEPQPVIVQPSPPPVVAPVSPTYTPKKLVVDLKADAKASKTSAVFKALTVRNVPAGSTVTATCAKGCRRESLTYRNVMGTVSLKLLFAKRAKQGTLKVGTKIRVVVSAPNSIAAVKTLTVRARRAPSVATRCLAPGAATETLCA